MTQVFKAIITSPSISADGRYVAFLSYASNLVNNDTNHQMDIFVRDMVSNKTTRVSVDSAGNEGNWASHSPSISADGRFVAFSSASNNLVVDDEGETDIFLHDRDTGSTSRVSIAIYNDGQTSNWSTNPSISASGRYITFTSKAYNLVPDDYNGIQDVFVFDTVDGEIIRVSVDNSGAEGFYGSGANATGSDEGNAVISADGRFVSFVSNAALTEQDSGDGWDVYLRDMESGKVTLVAVDDSGNKGDGHSFRTSISDDSRYIAFSSVASNFDVNDTNAQSDTYVHDVTTGITERVTTNGVVGDGGNVLVAISGNGRFIAFDSMATNLIHEPTESLFNVLLVANPLYQ